ncbi:MAG: nucleotidyl transferase AbiEii/AbiGii toxin family protein [Ignavibacteriales bacterium]|nr:nucleotidyl transferase AbiEii/AbiGii toxin family protein [Ignavibacteriales bacterium]MBP9890040.1 nucleotidyl transferase AbiEii/AbiGii toxin family protein [Leptospiraceae bacterium]
MKEKKEIKNIAASVKEKLRNISTQSGREFQSVVSQYVQERFLYRLSESIYSNNLILKGALLFIAHDISRNRPTRDIDFLGSKIPNEIKDLVEVIKEILIIKTEDGLRFDSESVEAENITEDGDYKGVRIKFYAFLENSRERMQLDIGFGDMITAGPVEIEFPTLLDFPAPKLKVYSIETAIAEKFEAIVSLQLQTSRMKDFYDIQFFAKHYDFKKDILIKAIKTTFNNRSTDLALNKIIFEDKFKNDENFQILWSAFLDRNKLEKDKTFFEAVSRIQSFIQPVFDSKTKNNWNPEKWKWE